MKNNSRFTKKDNNEVAENLIESGFIDLLLAMEKIKSGDQNLKNEEDEKDREK